jgi:phenylacetyl-CoA:acceptor oxidoreductase subunit 2
MVATGLTEGNGLFLAASVVIADLKPLAGPAAATVVGFAAVRALLWRNYRHALRASGAPTRSIDVLARFHPWFFVCGLVLPTLLAVAGFALPQAATALFALTGLCAFAAGWAMKFILVTRAAFNQGFALPHTPLRGSGSVGPAVKPGWILPAKT